MSEYQPGDYFSETGRILARVTKVNGHMVRGYALDLNDDTGEYERKEDFLWPENDLTALLLDDIDDNPDDDGGSQMEVNLDESETEEIEICFTPKFKL